MPSPDPDVLPGGEGYSTDYLYRRLIRRVRDYKECTEEKSRPTGSTALKCEEILDELGALIRKHEDEQYRSLGGARKGEDGGGGPNDLNYHTNTFVPEAILPTLMGQGPAPANAVQIGTDADGNAILSWGGYIGVWKAGADGLGSADDELLSLTDVATGTTWDYADGRAISAKDSAGNILSEYGYDDETKIITVSQTDGSVFKYSYRDSGDPFGTSTLTSARFQRDGEWVTQSYERDACPKCVMTGS